MGTLVSSRGIGLASHSLWRNEQCARAAAKRRDWPAVNACLSTIRQIAAHASSQALRASAERAIQSVACAASLSGMPKENLQS